MIDLDIGTEFRFSGKRLRVEEARDLPVGLECQSCYFLDKSYSCCTNQKNLSCSSGIRHDGKSVIFKVMREEE